MTTVEPTAIVYKAPGTDGLPMLNDIPIDEPGKLLLKYLGYDGFSTPLIKQYDKWLNEILPAQIASRSVQAKTGRYYFTNKLEFKAPVITPHEGYVDGQSYVSDLYAGIGWHGDNDPPGVIQELSSPVYMGKIPVMVGSSLSLESGLTETEQLMMGFCPKDPKGYFIIKGSEKLILLQEKMRANRPYTFYMEKKPGAKAGSKGRLNTRMTCVTMTGSQMVLLREGKVGNVRLSLPFLKKNIKKQENRSMGVIQAFRLLGIMIDEHYHKQNPNVVTPRSELYSTDEHIIETIMSFAHRGSDDEHKILNALNSSFIKIDQERYGDDYEYIAKKIGISSLPFHSKKAHIMTRLVSELFPQISPNEAGIEPVIQKYNMLAIMTVRMIEVLAGVRKPDDRDSWSNKRLDSAAIYMQQLFNGLFANMIAKTEAQLADLLNFTPDKGLSKFVHGDVITEGFISAFSAPEWGIKGAYYKENVTDFLNRYNLLSAYSHMRRVNVPTSRKAKLQKIRMVQNSSYGYICAAETPEGQACLSMESLVMMPDGTTRRLKDLKPGDVVLTMDPVTLEITETKIFNNFSLLSDKHGKQMYRIVSSDGREVFATGDHPFVTQHGIVQTDQLDPTRHLLAMYDNNKASFKPIASITPADPCMVGDFTTVSQNHTFIANGFCVGNCGLVKNLTTLAYISIDRNELIIRKYIEKLRTTKKDDTHNTPCILNGKMLGWVDGQKTYDQLVIMKRTGGIYYDTSVVIDYDGLLCISCDASRLMRPLLVIGDGKTPLVRDDIAPEKQEISKPGIPIFQQLGIDLDKTDWITLLSKGCVEYVDPQEQEFIKVAMYWRDVEEQQSRRVRVEREAAESDLLFSQTDPADPMYADRKAKAEQDAEIRDEVLKARLYTHAEIDPSGIISVALSVMPLCNHDQGPRLAYCSNMMKQAIGINHSQYMHRFETTGKTLAFPEIPLFVTQTEGIIGLEELPAGQNIIAAFMPDKGYTQEDAFGISKTMLENGGFTMIKTIGKRTTLKSTREFSEHLGRPEIRKGDPEDRYKWIGQDGLPVIGAVLRRGDCVIGKYRSNHLTKTRENVSQYIGLSEDGIVEDWSVSRNEANVEVIKVKIRQVRIPEEGDKFASRSAQKGTIGFIDIRENLPWVASGPNAGMTPDLITNPLCMPSRMTIGKLIEMANSKLAVRLGKRINATAFRYSYTENLAPGELTHIDQLRQELERLGFKRTGYEKMRSGETGKLLEGEIFIAPCYYQELRHQVRDKIQMRSGYGMVSQLTRQPVGGRMRGGGQRFGGQAGLSRL